MLAAVVAFAGAALTARVDGPSMAPTLRDGDTLLVDKVSPHFQPPHRSDVVIVLEPNGVAAVKRVIALPGDTVEIVSSPRPSVRLRPAGASAWETLAEPYIAPDWGRPESCCDANGRDDGDGPHPLTLPAGEYFVLGDNRGISVDSRSFGLVAGDRITGHVLFRYLPASRATRL